MHVKSLRRQAPWLMMALSKKYSKKQKFILVHYNSENVIKLLVFNK